MFQTEASSEPEPARVLVDIPIECTTMLKEIINLVDPRFQSVVADVLRLVPKDILLSIIEAAPHSKIKIIECLDSRNMTLVRYASIIKKWPTPECLKNVNWRELMGPYRDQDDHDVCWAIVVSELIRAVRLIEKPNQDPNVRYSPQDLIDFSDPVKRRKINDSGHRCYTSNLTKGFEYVMEHGIQREEDRPFTGCSENIPDRESSSHFGYIKGFVKLDSIESALPHLKGRPIGAALAMFHPEYKTIGNKVYRGPVNHKSMFYGLHAVSLLYVGEENGEKYVVARASHGANFGFGGCIKISLEVMLVYIPNPGEEINKFISKYLAKPSFLLRRFSYPRLYTEHEEEIKKKDHQDKMKNLRRDHLMQE